MSPRNSVQRAFDAFGKTRFREKTSGRWRRRTGDIEQSLHLQKSQYSLRYYINVELTFDTPAGTGRIFGRAERLLSPSDATRLEALLDLDGVAMPEEQREHHLLALLDQLAPLLDELSSLAAVRAQDRQGRFTAMGVSGPARRALDGT